MKNISVPDKITFVYCNNVPTKTAVYNNENPESLDEVIIDTKPIFAYLDSPPANIIDNDRYWQLTLVGYYGIGSSKSPNFHIVNQPFNNHPRELTICDNVYEMKSSYRVTFDDDNKLYRLNHDSLVYSLLKGGIKNGKLAGKFVFARSGSHLVLVDIDSPILRTYDEIIYRKTRPKIKISELEPGSVYTNLAGDNRLFLGRISTSTSGKLLWLQLFNDDIDWQSQLIRYLSTDKPEIIDYLGLFPINDLKSLYDFVFGDIPTVQQILISQSSSVVERIGSVEIDDNIIDIVRDRNIELMRLSLEKIRKNANSIKSTLKAGGIGKISNKILSKLSYVPSRTKVRGRRLRGKSTSSFKKSNNDRSVPTLIKDCLEFYKPYCVIREPRSKELQEIPEFMEEFLIFTNLIR